MESFAEKQPRKGSCFLSRGKRNGIKNAQDYLRAAANEFGYFLIKKSEQVSLAPIWLG